MITADQVAHLDPVLLDRFVHLYSDVQGLIADRVHAEPARADRVVRVEPFMSMGSLLGFTVYVDGVSLCSQGGLDAHMLRLMDDPHQWARNWVVHIPAKWYDAHWGCDLGSYPPSTFIRLESDQ